MKPLAIMTLATLAVTLAMTAAIAHAPATNDTPRPKPRPLMDCWVNHDTGAVDCEVRG